MRLAEGSAPARGRDHTWRRRASLLDQPRSGEEPIADVWRHLFFDLPSQILRVQLMEPELFAHQTLLIWFCLWVAE
jgi:hypothetical protein